VEVVVVEEVEGHHGHPRQVDQRAHDVEARRSWMTDDHLWTRDGFRLVRGRGRIRHAPSRGPCARLDRKHRGCGDGHVRLGPYHCLCHRSCVHGHHEMKALLAAGCCFQLRRDAGSEIGGAGCDPNRQIPYGGLRGSQNAPPNCQELRHPHLMIC
jgi:hypothetical protein